MITRRKEGTGKPSIEQRHSDDKDIPALRPTRLSNSELISQRMSLLLSTFHASNTLGATNHLTVRIVLLGSACFYPSYSSHSSKVQQLHVHEPDVERHSNWSFNSAHEACISMPPDHVPDHEG